MEIIRLTGFDLVKDNLIKLQEEYLKYNQLIKHNFGFFVFPDTLFKDILNDVGKIKKILIDKNDIENKYFKKDYDLLSFKIYDFCAKIMKSSFDNIIFENIKRIKNELLNYFQNIDLKTGKIKGFDDSLDDNLCNIEEQNINHENNNLYNFSISQNQEENDINNDLSFEDKSQMDLSNIDNENEIVQDDDQFINEKYNNIYSEIRNKYNYKLYYVNMIIKEESFNQETPLSIKSIFPDCEILFNFKKIQDEFVIKQCKISKDKLKSKYNFIIPNLELEYIKGGEIYFPPYKWFGIGIDNKKIYKNKNEQKALAYYGFKGMNPRNIKMMINNIIMGKGFNIDYDLQPKCRFFDKRKPKKYVGNGIYLTPKINIIEKNTGIVYFNKKAYKIALMAKVLTDKIRQPDNDYWILNPNEIEIIRIIFKEIYL
jgi:hypothetical protein